MNWDGFKDLWDEFLAFTDRVMKWLLFLFVGGEENPWPPEEYPDMNA